MIKGYVGPLLSVLAFMLSITQLHAQGGAGNNVEEEEINVVKPYQPTLSDAVKLNAMPERDTSAVTLPAMSYEIASRKINTAIEVTPIKPVKLKDETISKLYKNFAKVGFGNYTTPYGELFVNSLRSKDAHFGTHIRHLSSTGRIPGTGYSGYSENSASLYGKKLVQNEWLGGDVTYNRDVVHHYGFSTSDTTLGRNQIRQRYSYIGGAFRVAGNLTDSSKIRHEAEISYYNLGDLYRAQEDRLHIRGHVASRTSIGDLKVSADVDYSNNKLLPFHLDRTYIYVLPELSRRIDRWTLTGGLNLVTELENSSGGFHIYPKALVEVNLLDNILIAYGSLSGNLHKTNLRDLSQENPFVSSSISYRPQNEKLVFTGGLKGTLTNATGFNVQVSYREVLNMPFFVADSSLRPSNRFAVLYDNARLLNLHGELSHQYSEKWRLLVKADYFNYSLTTEKQPWHRPPFTATLGTTYSIGSKIYLKADVFAFSSRYAKVYEPAGEKKLKGFVDANLGIDYRYSKIFSLFLNFNNIGAVRYYYWDNYPSQRFNLLGGLTYSF
jgi:hypothetical protein